MAYNPIRVLDGAILNQYAKVRRVWEAKGHSIYPLSFTLTAVSFPVYGTGSIISALGGSLFLGSAGNTVGATLLYGFYMGQSLFLDVYGQLADDLEATSHVKDRVVEYFRKSIRVARLPFFLAGNALFGNGVYLTANFLRKGDVDIYNLIGYLAAGLGVLASSSSMYLKDADPKLLQKQPSKIKAKLKEFASRIKDFIPRPSPVPKPTFQSTYEQMLYSV